MSTFTTDRYQLLEPERLLSPSLLVFKEIMEDNLVRMIQIAGEPTRLRPHCKTHKMAAIIRRLVELGVTKHKCATIAEAEMVAAAGVTDLLLAYPPIGPNIERVIRLLDKYPQLNLIATADHQAVIRPISEAMSKAGKKLLLLLDINTGMNRTGVLPDADAKQLYQLISELPGVEPAGFHVYDGHHRQPNFDERQAAVNRLWADVSRLRASLEESGLKVPRIVAGGTGSFPCFATIDDPTLELSPGTTVFYDAGYSGTFPDMKFEPAAVLLTRVISRPGENLLCVDLGHKACAADPPAGSRLAFPALPDAQERIHSEEHLVLESEEARKFQPGDWLLAIPTHICPTTALHQEVYVIEGGRCVETWQVTARDRRLTI